uniref:Uncharacterized protein n=1 Tax=Anguilla anguilla TaxID=7936 RepID=A0A0E9VIK3_ANGAN
MYFPTLYFMKYEFWSEHVTIRLSIKSNIQAGCVTFITSTLALKCRLLHKHANISLVHAKINICVQKLDTQTHKITRVYA